MKKKLFCTALCVVFASLSLHSQYVGINTTNPKTSLQIEAKDVSSKISGLVIPRLSGDDIYNMPVETIETNDNVSLEANLVYATSAATTTNQTGHGVNLTGKGFYYWDGDKWVTIINNTINNIWSQVKPMNILLSDNDTYSVVANHPLIAPTGPALTRVDPDFFNTTDSKIENNPLSVIMWDNTNKLIKVPQQLLGHTITINLSLKFQKLTSNAEASRLVAYTGNATVNTTSGSYTGGAKIKDLMFTGTKTATGTDETNSNYVRDELVLSPVIITQSIIDNGIKLYIGSAMNGNINFFEPILTVDYGVVNTSL